MRVSIELLVTPVRSTSSLDVTSKDMNDTVLDFFRSAKQVHVITTSTRTFDLQIITVILMEPLQGFDEQEIGCKLTRTVSLAEPKSMR